MLGRIVIIRFFLFAFLEDSKIPRWDDEEEVTSQLTLLGLVGIDTLDEFVSAESQ